MSSVHRVYDYRIREQVVRTGNPDLFPELEIPRGTALTWLRRGMPDVVWLGEPDSDNAKLRERVARNVLLAPCSRCRRRHRMSVVIAVHDDSR